MRHDQPFLPRLFEHENIHAECLLSAVGRLISRDRVCHLSGTAGGQHFDRVDVVFGIHAALHLGLNLRTSLHDARHEMLRQIGCVFRI